jgi:hypothetical protein
LCSALCSRSVPRIETAEPAARACSSVIPSCVATLSARKGFPLGGNEGTEAAVQEDQRQSRQCRFRRRLQRVPSSPPQRKKLVPMLLPRRLRRGPHLDDCVRLNGSQRLGAGGEVRL